ncbi:MAG TPA: right-handed parallel beta-helix repeat-containing protein, partial [Actinomycetota bacterium]|nr:right-handed parallel beta-helix repeat-containing protein [Actinomycetota bacterium]
MPPSAATSGTVYRVVTDGSDDADGSAAHPLATIQRALTLARPGDTVVVAAGSYAPARFVRGGTTDRPITLEAEGNVTIDGPGNGYGIEVDAVGNVVIDGFTISGFEVGIALIGSRDVTIRDNTLQGNDAAGVQVWKAEHVTVEQNRFLDPGDPSDLGTVQDYGVNFYYSSFVAADRNYFFGRHDQALSFKRRDLHGTANGNTFEGCLFTCIYVGQNDDDEDGDMTSQDIVVRENRFRPAIDPTTHVSYRARTPITLRNVTGAVVEDNVIDPG